MSASLEVVIEGGSYPVHISGSAATAISIEIARLDNSGRKNLLVCDAAVAHSQASFLKRAFGLTPQLVLEGGEKTKTLAGLGRILEFLAAEAADRDAVLWIVGGGVLGDAGGFAAAVYLRGIDCVQVPTSLLAMVDSAVGGKTGLNLPAGKNLVGAFHQPLAVFIAPELLATLPPAEFAAGMAEVLKYGLLGDAALFALLETEVLSADAAGLPGVIRRCCEMKAAIVQADVRETAAEGGRAILNLGHTFAHAIEQVTRFEAYRHGEAVAIGLMGAARLSEKLGCLKAGDVARIENALSRHGLPIRLRQPLDATALFTAMRSDKKTRAGQLRFVVLAGIGEARTQSGVDPRLVATVWRDLGATD